MTMPCASRTSPSRERDCPFLFPRSATPTTAAIHVELHFPNAMRQLDPGDRDGRVLERLEARHRLASQRADGVTAKDMIVEIVSRGPAALPQP